jgi:hypothetical protein
VVAGCVRVMIGWLWSFDRMSGGRRLEVRSWILEVRGQKLEAGSRYAGRCRKKIPVPDRMIRHTNKG